MQLARWVVYHPFLLDVGTDNFTVRVRRRDVRDSTHRLDHGRVPLWLRVQGIADEVKPVGNHVRRGVDAVARRDLGDDAGFRDAAGNSRVSDTGHKWAKVKFGEFTKEAYDEWRAKGGKKLPNQMY